MRTQSGAQGLKAHLIVRGARRVAAAVLLSFLTMAAYAQSCAPDAPRSDSGAGFVPFGENEQVLARAGNKGRAWEWAIGTDTDAGQKVQGSLDWVSGKVYRWKLINSGSGSEVLEIRDGRRLRLRLVYPSGMDAGNALELQVSANPRIGPRTTLEASVTRLNGHSVSGSVSQSGTRGRAAQALYYFFPPMVQGFIAEGTVRLTYARKPPKGSRVEFTVRAGTIPCASNGNPPTVSITAPAASSVFTAPAIVTVTADAQDSDGTISQVEFFANGNPIGTATSSPYEIEWANVQAGAYSLTAVATDGDGYQSTSTAVPITVDAAQALYYIHVDHLNTPRLISGATQNTVWRWEQQEPFGSNIADEDPDGDSLALSFSQRFPGQYYDAETLLHYNYFREYDANLGRYEESDPIGLNGGLNTYSYVGSSPLAAIDPSGEIVWSGTMLSRGLVGPFGAVYYELTLTSECIDGQRATVDVLAVGPAVGSGLRVSQTRGTVWFYDHQAQVLPTVFNGAFVVASASAVVGSRGGGLAKLHWVAHIRWKHQILLVSKLD